MKFSPTILDRFQISGFIVSASISVVLVFLGQDTIQSVILGLVLAILTQLFDIQLRHSDAEVRLLEANTLNKALYRDEWLLKHIRQIVDDYQEVQGGWFDLFNLSADDAIIECRNIIHGLAEGNLYAPFRSKFTFGSAELNNAKRTIKSVESGDVSFWRSPYGEKNLKVNADVIERGVELTRIFIVPDDSLDEITDILQRQQDAGIQVYIASPDSIDRDLHEDYLLMDDLVFTKTEFTGDGHTKREQISIDEIQVERLAKKFDTLLRHSIKYGRVNADEKRKNENSIE